GNKTRQENQDSKPAQHERALVLSLWRCGHTENQVHGAKKVRLKLDHDFPGSVLEPLYNGLARKDSVQHVIRGRRLINEGWSFPPKMRIFSRTNVCGWRLIREPADRECAQKGIQWIWPFLLPR